MMARIVWRLLASAAVTMFCLNMAWADITLPSPQQKGGDGIYDTLKNRRSFVAAELPVKALNMQEVSNLLWAASGMNRPTKWTVPLAKGKPPYVKIYYADSTGVFLYNWKQHSLKQISAKNILGTIAKQGFVAKMPATFILVADGQALKAFEPQATKRDYANIAAGAMTQNMYLVAASMKIGTRYIVYFKPEVLQIELKLEKEDFSLAIMPVGK